MADKETPSQSDGDASGTLDVELLIPEGMPVYHADMFAVQSSVQVGMFLLSFFHTQYPMDNTDPEKVRAQCFIRLAVSPQTLAKISATIQSHLRSYKDRLEKTNP